MLLCSEMRVSLALFVGRSNFISQTRSILQVCFSLVRCLRIRPWMYACHNDAYCGVGVRRSQRSRYCSMCSTTKCCFCLCNRKRFRKSPMRMRGDHSEARVGCHACSFRFLQQMCLRTLQFNLQVYFSAASLATRLLAEVHVPQRRLLLRDSAIVIKGRAIVPRVQRENVVCVCLIRNRFESRHCTCEETILGQGYHVTRVHRDFFSRCVCEWYILICKFAFPLVRLLRVRSRDYMCHHDGYCCVTVQWSQKVAQLFHVFGEKMWFVFVVVKPVPSDVCTLQAPPHWATLIAVARKSTSRVRD